MSRTVAPEDLLGQIVRRDVVRVVRSSTIIYLVNAGIVILPGRVLPSIFTSYYSDGFLGTLFDFYATAIAVYAMIVYIWSRSRQSRNLASHVYILGVLGLTLGTLLFAWGAVQYLSAGYWLRQYFSGRCKSGVDEGEVAIYGTDKLVNTKSSRLVRIGFDIPRRWTFAGIGLLLAALVWYVISSLLVQLRFYNISQAFLIDGIAFLTTWYAEKTYGGGRIRLPENTPESSH